MEKIIISCLESRVETNRSMYARFLLGPFKDDNAVTIATALRRSLLSKVKSIAITAIHIQGVTHEFSTIVGVRESVLDLALNFQQVVLRRKTDGQTKRLSREKVEKGGRALEGGRSSLKGGGVERPQPDQALFGLDSLDEVKKETVEIGYLQVQGPAVVYANDLQLPAGIECVDPTQHIATLSTEGLLVVKFLIGKKKASFEGNNALTGKRVNVLATLPRRTKPSLRKNEALAQRAPGTAPSLLAGAPNQALTKSLGDKEALIANRAHTAPTHKNQSSAQLKGSSQVQSGKTDAKTMPYQDPTLVRRYPLANSFRSFDPTTCLRNTMFLDPIFDSVLQANYVIEKDDLFNQPRERVVLEFWTNGSVHPRQALHKASLSLISTFSVFREVFHLDSL